MKDYRRHRGYALIGAMMFLLIVMIMWLGVTRQMGTYLRMEKNLQLQKSYYDDSRIRALAWGLTLLETGYPPTAPYSCKMWVGQTRFVLTFAKTSGYRYIVTARSFGSGDISQPNAPSTFKVPLPEQAKNPNPATGATNVSRTPILSWTAGSGATSHDVYFGTSSTGTFQRDQASTTFSPGRLLYSTTYYWRIDEKNNGGTTTGAVWHFTTRSRHH